MNQQPDKLFRDKLKRYQKAAPAGAWDRINAGIPKEGGHTFRWLSIAASLLLLAAAVFLRWPDKKAIDRPALPTAQEKTSAPKTSADKKTEQPKIVQQKDEPKAPAEQKKVAPSQQNVPKQKEEKKKVIIPAEAPAEEITVVQAEEEQKTIRTREQREVITEPSGEEQPVVASTTPAAAQPDEQNIKLVFSAEESEEYLDKKALAEATSSDKKPSTLKKLLKKAEDLATNQDPFGELRQKKNEILALSFKTDKQRGQNK